MKNDSSSLLLHLSRFLSDAANVGKGKIFEVFLSILGKISWLCAC
ncbi:hypothetical protein [Halpernia humi]|nr:hypothetical protein [Halpernia humi]